MSQSGTTQTGSLGSDKINIQDLTIAKYVDRASPYLMLASATGKHYPEVRLVFSSEVAQNYFEEVEIVMQDVLVSSVSVGAAGQQTGMSESVSFNFGKVRFEYREIIDGKTYDNPAGFGWNLDTNMNY